MTGPIKRDRGWPRLAYNLCWLAEHVAGDGAIGARLGEARESLALHATRAVSPNATRTLQVARRRDLSPDEFRREYLGPGIPVVLEGFATDWPAARKWTPAFFAENHGDVPIQLINAAVEDLDGDQYDPAGRTTTVAQVVAAIEAGERDYPRFVPLLHLRPELQRDFDAAALLALRGTLSLETMFQFFMGGAGTNTALHGAIPNNFFVQVYGRKQWWIYPPASTPVFRPPMLRATYFMSPVDVAAEGDRREAGLEAVQGWTTVLEPGDVLYNPPFYWHQVHNLTTTIGVGMRWFGVASILRSSVTQTLLTLMSTNPPVWRARRNRTDFVKNFTESRPARVRRPS